MEMIVPKNIGRAKLVRKERLERAWPQSQLAEIAGVDIRTIQRLEKEGAASFETLRGVAQAFDIDVKELEPTPKGQKDTKPTKNIHLLPRLTSGEAIGKLIWGSDQFQIEHDEIGNERDLSFMMSILNVLKGDVVRWHDGDLSKKLKIEFELSQALKEFEKVGFYLFGIKRLIPLVSSSGDTQITMCTIYMSHSRSPRITRDKKSNLFIPAKLTEVANSGER